VTRVEAFVDSIIIETNKQTSQRFGGSGGLADYLYQAPDGYEIIGFNGNTGSFTGEVLALVGFDVTSIPIDLSGFVGPFIVSLGVILRKRS